MSKTHDSNEMSPEDVVFPVKRADGDTLEDQMTGNAYNNILPARYLRQDKDGNIVETPEELFERIANNIALAEVAYADEPVYVTPDQIKEHHDDVEGAITEVFGTGVEEGDDVEVELTEFNVNNFSYENVVPELENDDLRERVEDIRETFHDLMPIDFIPNSPTLMNAGAELQQLSACFVNSPDDDIENIHETVKEAAQVFQSGGGMGYAFWQLRPYGDAVGSTGGIASGPISFMRTFDQMCRTIAQGGKRRGAQMGVFKVDHPDVIEFIHAKNKDVSLAHALMLNDPKDYTHSSFKEALEEARGLIDEDGKVPSHLRNAVEAHLSNFNISVGVTDPFMEALKNGEDYDLINPRTGEVHIATEHTKELYDRYDLGEYVTPGEPLSLPAEKIWERIISGAWENGEPGVIFLDRVNKQHSFDVTKEDNSDYEILATNPCGEQPLMEYEACNLGHINLSTLVADVESTQRDWRVWSEEHGDEYDTLEAQVAAFLDDALDLEELDHRIEYGTRFLENVVTMSDFPIDEIEETVHRNRKIGLGIMGLAQMKVQLGVEYGSEVGNEITEQVMRYINHGSKAASHDIAKERGPFPNFEDSKYASPTDYPEWFTQQTGEDPADYEDGYIVRNHNTTTIAPTGTTGMLADTSGGCEPIFSVAYFKNVAQDVQGDEMLVEFDDYFLRTLEANDIDVDEVQAEAVEQMQNNEYDGIEGLSTVPDAIGDLFVVTEDLSGLQHAGVQCAAQQGVDSAISKTVNAPNDASLDDAKEAFEFIYDHGGKGVTYYRDGTRSKQVLTTRADNTEFADEEEALDAIREFAREEENRAEIIKVIEEMATEDDDQNEPVILGGDAEEMFTPKRDRPDALFGVSQRIPTGYGKVYVTINEDADGQPFELFANIGSSGGFTNGFVESLAKTISLALRSGVDPREIADELKGTRSPKVAWDKGEQINSIPDAFGVALLRYLDGDIEGSNRAAAATSLANKSTGDDAGDEADDTETETPDIDGKSTGEDAAQDLIEAGEAPECPECGEVESLAYQEGCLTCIPKMGGCGWSKCS